MPLDKVDLNLFVVFEAIYAERNLTRAAEALHVTQPAMSNALRRLRGIFDDQLFVRSSDGMSPTPVADNVIGRVRNALRLLDSSISEYDRFDPATSDRTFKIAMGDMAEALFLPELLQQLAELAPNTSLRTFIVPREELASELANYSVDLAVDAPVFAGQKLLSMPLSNDRYVCVLRRGHPMAKATLTLSRYLEMSHMHVSSRRRGIGQVDLALRELGEKRRIGIRTQHYTVAPLILKDYALSIPSTLADRLGLSHYQLPFRVPHLKLCLFWHENADTDAANQWLRSLFTPLEAAPAP